MGKTIEDAEESLGFPRGWTDIGKDSSELQRWAALRYTQTIGCQLNDLFFRYLGRQIEGPDSGAEHRANRREFKRPNRQGR